MLFIKKWVIPCLAGGLVAFIMRWGLDAFEPNDTAYFVRIFLESLISVTFVTILLRWLSNRNKAKQSNRPSPGNNA